MADRATISRHYSIRLLIIGLGAFFMGLYFLYDGMVKYPHLQHIQLTYEQLKEEYPSNFQAQWEAFATEQGWSTDIPVPKSDWDIYTQRIIAAGLIPVGLVVLVFFALNRRKWIEADDQGLRDHAGRDIGWDRINTLDKTRWDTKGIAVLHFDDGGKPSRLVLDDWKFDRVPIGRIVDRIDEHLGNHTESEESEETPAL